VDSVDEEPGNCLEHLINEYAIVRRNTGLEPGSDPASQSLCEAQERQSSLSA
jgi:hypothetical protein